MYVLQELNIKESSRLRIYALGILIRFALLGFFAENWDMFVFTTVAKQFVLEGKTPYDVVMEDPPYIYLPFAPYIQNWYAYPPLPLLIFSAFYLLYLILPVRGVFWERFFIKLPMALGDILLAWVIGRIMTELGKNEKRLLAEKSVLFNPFIIYLSSIWGMFDATVLAFLLLSILYLMQNKYELSGIFLGVAVLMKQTAVLAGLILFITVWKRENLKKAIQLFVVSGATFSVVSLPFLIDNFQGFLMQNLSLHANRPPWGFNIFALIYIAPQVPNLLIRLVEHFQLTTLPVNSLLYLINYKSILNSILSLISFTLLSAGILHIALSHMSRDHSGKNGLLCLLHSNMLIYGIFLWFNKVTNEQYFIYFIGFTLILALYSDHRKYLTIFKRFSVFIPLASMIIGLRILLFVPQDIWIMLLGVEKSTEILSLSPLGGYLNGIAVIFSVISGILMSYVMIKVFAFFLPYFKIAPYMTYVRSEIEKISLVHLRKIFMLISKHLSYKKLLAFVFLILLINNIPKTISSLQSMNSTGIINDDKLVGIYYLWWANPTHNSSVKAGPWINTSLTPIEGYYDTTRPYVVEDISEFKRMGIDFAVLDYIPGDQFLVDLFAEICSEEEFRFIISINLHRYLKQYDITENLAPHLENGSVIEGYYSLSNETIYSINSFYYDILMAIHYNSYLNMSGSLPVIIRGINIVMPGWSYEEKTFLAKKLVEMYIQNYNLSGKNAALRKISEKWGTTIYTFDQLLSFYPASIENFRHPKTEIEKDWRRTFVYAWKTLWRDFINMLKMEIDENIVLYFEVAENPLDLISIEDFYELGVNSFVYFPNEESDDIINTFLDSIETIYNLSSIHDSRFIASVFPQFNKINYPPLSKFEVINLYSHIWTEILNMSKNLDIIVVYAWNDYHHASVIEPTVEYGYKLANLTSFYVSSFKLS